MRKLTEKILNEEAKKYFEEIKATIDVGMDNPLIEETKISVFPEYKEWKKSKGKKETLTYLGCKSIGWAMQEYINNSLGLARHLLEKNYPQEAILNLLPKGFAQSLVKKLIEDN